MPRSMVTLTTGERIIVNDSLKHDGIGIKLADLGYWTTDQIKRDKKTKITLMLHGVATIEPAFVTEKEVTNLTAGDYS